MKTLDQQFHQRPMIKDPTDSTLVLVGGRQIGFREHNLLLDAFITQIERSKWTWM